MDVIVCVGYFFSGLLGGGVEGGRPVGAVVLGEWVVGIEAVDGAGAGPDDSRLRVGGFGRLEEGDEARYVGADVR